MAVQRHNVTPNTPTAFVIWLDSPALKHLHVRLAPDTQTRHIYGRQGYTSQG